MTTSDGHIANDLVKGILKSDHGALARAITYCESTLPAHQAIAAQILEKCLPTSGKAFRLGITGPPGVGKSTFINALGMKLLNEGRKMAVLAVDPSSSKSKGSILGDKTRMPDLIADKSVFIRPSPSAGTVGGITARTREAIVLCEAAGYDTILVETVGVGQSETKVYGMVDLFVLLILPGGGDALQGIKRGIMELADVLVVNKADGELQQKAEETAQQYKLAAPLMPLGKTGKAAEVFLCSALLSENLDVIWSHLVNLFDQFQNSGNLNKLRMEQELEWFEEYTQFLVLQHIKGRDEISRLEASLRDQIRAKKINPGKAAETLASFIFSKEG